MLISHNITTTTTTNSNKVHFNDKKIRRTTVLLVGLALTTLCDLTLAALRGKLRSSARGPARPFKRPPKPQDR